MDKKSNGLRGRLMGASTTAASIAVAQGNDPVLRSERAPTLAELRLLLARFEHARSSAQSRKQRQEELMSRKVAKTWNAAQKARAVRRLTIANQEVERSTEAIAEVVGLIASTSDRGTRAAVSNVAPFVPAPATSV